VEKLASGSRTGRDIVLRFEKNRWWTFVLALALCLACTASQSGPARAGGPGEIIEGDPTTGGGQPDQPIGPGKQSPGWGAAQWDGRGVQMRSVGDGRISTGVWMWRLQVIVRSLRSVYFRF